LTGMATRHQNLPPVTASHGPPFIWANGSLENVPSRNYCELGRVKSVIITVEHSAVLKLKNIKNRGEISVPEHTAIEALLSRLGVQAGHHKYLLAYVNGMKRSLSHILHDGDALQLFLPIGGG